MLETLGQPDATEQLCCARPRIFQRTTSDAHRHLDVLRRIELRQQVVKLEDEPDVAVAELHERVVAQRPQVGIGDANLPRICAIESTEKVKQRALPHA